MEKGVYISKPVEDVFDKLEKMNIRKVKKLISFLRQKYSNAQKYTEHVTLHVNNVTTENLTRVLGEFFFGSKKDTKQSFDDFVTLFNNISGKSTPKKSDTSTDKPRGTDPGSAFKSTQMVLSPELWNILTKVEKEKIGQDVCWQFINFVETEQKKPNKNVLGISFLTIDKTNPTLFQAKFANGKSTKIPIYNFLKQYFGTKFNSSELEKFSDIVKKEITSLNFEPGDKIKVSSFKFDPKDVRNTFISLVTETYPIGHEDDVVKFLDPTLQKDSFGNYYKIIGSSDTMFTCHLDTVSRKSKVNLISRLKDGDEFIASDGSTILGADDKAGVTVLSYMMAHNIPGVYYFFVGEESGGIGSGKVSDSFRKIPHLAGIRKCVSFDRRNYYSVITEQMYDVCCSEEFAQALCSELNKSGLNMGLDPTGVFTDSANFIYLIPECTNVSVGYFGEHTTKEALNISFLERLAAACLKVNWSELPVARTLEISDDFYKAWAPILSDMAEFGFNNDMRYSGTSKKMVINLNIDSPLFDDVLEDLFTLNYLFEKNNLEPKITFDESIIKFEIG